MDVIDHERQEEYAGDQFIHGFPIWGMAWFAPKSMQNIWS